MAKAAENYISLHEYLMTCMDMVDGPIGLRLWDAVAVSVNI